MIQHLRCLGSDRRVTPRMEIAYNFANETTEIINRDASSAVDDLGLAIGHQLVFAICEDTADSEYATHPKIVKIKILNLCICTYQRKM